ncbi:MAG: rRNA maturation RNase YbeY [Ruminococcaceae bacterium]|nr:rRNA maturation RNase YbeY [Oscillospiraceae bacterium]
MNYIDIDIEEGVEFPETSQNTVNEVIKRVIETEKLPFSVYISVMIVSADTIKEINAAERGIDRVTDVLSFPALDYDREYRLTRAPGPQDMVPEYEAVYLGDMVICDDKIKEQAKEYCHSYERELSYLTVHSMYHLLGYDHEDEAMKKDMRKKEENILKK